MPSAFFVIYWRACWIDLSGVINLAAPYRQAIGFRRDLDHIAARPMQFAVLQQHITGALLRRVLTLLPIGLQEHAVNSAAFNLQTRDNAAGRIGINLQTDAVGHGDWAAQNCPFARKGAQGQARAQAIFIGCIDRAGTACCTAQRNHITTCHHAVRRFKNEPQRLLGAGLAAGAQRVATVWRDENFARLRRVVAKKQC